MTKRVVNMVDKTFCVGASSCIATYLTAEVMPYVSFAIGVTSLVYMLSKLYYLIKHHGYEVPERHEGEEDEAVSIKTKRPVT